MEIKKVFSRKLSVELKKRGCICVGVEPNTYKPEYKVYLFLDNEYLRQVWNELNMERAKAQGNLV